MIAGTHIKGIIELDIVRKSCVYACERACRLYICVCTHTHTKYADILLHRIFRAKAKMPCERMCCSCVREKLKTKTKLVHGMVNIIQYISYSNSETCTEHTDSKLSVHTNTHTLHSLTHICLLACYRTRSCIRGFSRARFELFIQSTCMNLLIIWIIITMQIQASITRTAHIHIHISCNSDTWCLPMTSAQRWWQHQPRQQQRQRHQTR